jgi:hypothetical protein
VAVVGSGRILFAGGIQEMKKSSDTSLEKMFLEMTQNA